MKTDLMKEPDYKAEAVPVYDSNNNLIGYKLTINSKDIEDIDPGTVTDKKLKNILKLK